MSSFFGLYSTAYADSLLPQVVPTCGIYE